MTRLFLYCLGLVFLSLSCKKTDSNIEILIHRIQTSYFEDDSLNQVSGYDIPIVYFYFQIKNTTNKRIFVPLKTSQDTIPKSEICIIQTPYDSIDGMNVTKSRSIEESIKPGECMEGFISVVLSSQDYSNMLSIIKQFGNNASFYYDLHLQDTILSKSRIPTTINVKRKDSLSIEYRDVRTFGAHISWRL